MARKCQVTGKKPNFGNNVSHANNKTKKKQNPNLHRKNLFVPELGKSVSLRISTRAMRSIAKDGLIPYLKKQGLVLKDLQASA